MASKSGGYSDRAIESLEADRLQFGTYSRVLGRVISEADMPLTIGVFGAWGSGKTSLMRLVEESRREPSGGEGNRGWPASVERPMSGFETRVCTGVGEERGGRDVGDGVESTHQE